MIITAYTNKYKDCIDKKYHIIDGGDWDGLYCPFMDRTPKIHYGKIVIRFKLYNPPYLIQKNASRKNHVEFWEGLNIIDIEWEESKTNLEYRR